MTVRRRMASKGRAPQGAQPSPITPMELGDKILLVYNQRNPAYERICRAIAEHGKLDYRLASASAVSREAFNGVSAVYLTHWGMVDAVPTDFRGKILVGVWEGDSWLSGGRLTESSAKAFSRADKILAANSGFVRRLELLTGRPVSLFTDGVDTLRFRPMLHLRPHGQRLRVGIVGHNWRGDDHKGIEIAREACGIVGCDLVELSARYGEPGYLRHEEMPLWYNGLNAILVCSKEEGGPNPGLEAAACGLPVISTRVGVMPELLDERWLCDRSAAAFAEKLRELSGMTSGERKAVGRRNRDRIVAGGWGMEKKVSSFEDVLENDRSNPSAMQAVPIFQSPRIGQSRIVLCGTTLGIGGAERITVDMANTLSRSGWSVLVVLTVSESGVFRDQLDPAVQVRLAGDKNALLQDINIFHPDIVVLNNCWTALACANELRDRCQPARLVVMLHGSTRWSLERLSPELLPVVTDVLVVSEVIKQEIEKRNPDWAELVTVIENYVDTERFQPRERAAQALQRYGWPEDAMVFGYMGRMSGEKRLPVLIDIFQMVLQREPKARLLLIGGADPGVSTYGAHWERETRLILRSAKNLGIEDKVHITGLVSDPWNHLPMIDVFLLTSRSEGSPLALLEALSCGIPAVSTAVGTVPELLGTGAGRTLALGDTEFTDDERRSFAELMLEMAQSTDRKAMGRRGRELMEERFSFHAYQRRILSYFRQSLLRPSSPSQPAWSVVGMGGRDLTAEVTVFVSTVGSLEFDGCIDALRSQNCRFRLGIVRNVAPMSAAFQLMMDSCETPYYVQADEDMHLHADAIATLYDDIRNKEPHILLNCRPLYEPFRDIVVDGVKIYRHALARRYPLREQAFACEMDHIERFRADGYDFTVYPKSRPYAVGLLNVSWDTSFYRDEEQLTIGLYDIYEKFRRDAQKYHLGTTGIGIVKIWAPRLLDRCRRGTDPFDLFALLGLVAGCTEYGQQGGEKDFHDTTARQEFDRLRRLFTAIIPEQE